MCNDIIVKMPKLPKIRYKKCRRRMNNKKLPRLKMCTLQTTHTMNAIIAGLKTEVININSIKQQRTGTQKGKVIGAGRGGQHIAKVSSMGRMAESATKPKRKKREHKPYKPTPMMHTLYSLEDMRRF